MPSNELPELVKAYERKMVVETLNTIIAIGYKIGVSRGGSSVNISKIYFEAYKGSEPYIFISYAHKDSHIVYPIIQDLHEMGYNFWYDEGIDPGNEWPDEIAKALEKCAYFIVFISYNSANSRNVMNEINFAIDENKPFLAIHIEETKLPVGLRLRTGSTQAIMKYKMENESFKKKLDLVLANKISSISKGVSVESYLENFPRIDRKNYINNKKEKELINEEFDVERWKEEDLFYGRFTAVLTFDNEDFSFKNRFDETKKVDLSPNKYINDKYKIIKKVGYGGLGTTYLLEDINGLYYIGKVAHEGLFCEDLLNWEATILSKICIDGIPKCIDYFEGIKLSSHQYQNQMFDSQGSKKINANILIEEFIEGDTLEDELKKTSLCFNDGLKYCIQICEIIKKLHEIDILHNNITTTNIIIDSKNKVNIVDLGVSSVINNYQYDFLCASLYYIPPELIGITFVNNDMWNKNELNKYVTIKSEVYSFGVLMFKIFSNQFPLVGTIKEYRRLVLNTLPRRIDDLPNEIWSVIKKCLEKRPEDRYNSFEEIYQDMEKV